MKKNTKAQTRKKTNDSVLFGDVTVGTKGQFVIPVEARNKLNINPGDHLLVFGNKNNNILAVIKSSEISKLLGDLTELGLKR